MAAKHGGLGRGLGALIREVPEEARPAGAPAAPAELRLVPVDRIRAGRWQPRRRIRPEALEELAASIRARGVLQPLLVREAGEDFELIAGERRLRAASAAGLERVPVKVMAVDDREAMELALIENLQREDLDPIEEAEGYRTLAEQYGLTQEKIAERVGRGRATVANALRLLALPGRIKELVEEGRLTAGHAKVLLGLAIEEEQVSMAERAARDGLSVRDLERLVARARRPPRKPRAFRPDFPDTHRRHIEEQLQQKLGTAVAVVPSRTLANGRKAKGVVSIEYYTADDLDRLMILLGISDDF